MTTFGFRWSSLLERLDRVNQWIDHSPIDPVKASILPIGTGGVDCFGLSSSITIRPCDAPETASVAAFGVSFLVEACSGVKPSSIQLFDQ